MLPLPAAIGTFLLVNVLCACVALGVGFAAGVWFFGARKTKTVLPAALPTAPAAARPKPSGNSERTTERVLMASGRLADVAQGVAGDVGAHAAKMRAISADLQGIDRKAGDAGAEVATALDKILTANAELQQRLELAEKLIAQQAADLKSFESLARTDSLTGLANRRAFDDELRRRLHEFDRKQTPCTLILLDIDHFKKFNDTHGHEVGDEVLRQVAKTLQGQSRHMDLPCRYGGEEFGIILPATNASGACMLAERIRKAVERATTRGDQTSLNVTISLGLAEFEAGDDPSRLIRRADAALYKSKEAGRNCGHWNTGREFVPITPTVDAAAIGTPMAPASAPVPTEIAVGSSVAGGPFVPRVPQGTSFIHMLKRRVTESHRFGIPLSLMHLKIEEYDWVARNYGKLVARQLIDATTQALEKSLREVDALAPLEHGEFLVLMPGNTQSEAGQVAKRMRLALNNCMIPLVDREIPIRFRYSIAELAANESAKELLARAKQGLLATCGIHT